MDVNWIKITDRTRDGITIINKLPNSTFSNVLKYVTQQMLKSHKYICGERYVNVPTYEENENTLEELERSVGINRSDFLLLIKTISYILRRINTYIFKPSMLEAELKEKLQIQDKAKIDAIVRVWIQQSTPFINNLANEGYEANASIDLAWKLNVQISSQCQQRDKSAFALLQLKTCAGKDINWEMNYEELMQLSQQLESVHNELNGVYPL